MKALTERISSTGSLISSLANVWIFNGNPDESISARSYRLATYSKHNGWIKARRFIDLLFSPIEKEHCRKAFVKDYERAKGMLSMVEK